MASSRFMIPLLSTSVAMAIIYYVFASDIGFSGLIIIFMNGGEQESIRAVS